MGERFKILNTKEVIKEIQKYNFKAIHIHHTWKPDHSDYNGANGIRLQENMFKYHTQVNGWADIGQHLTLLPDGKWVTGRAFNKTPASITGHNTGALAIEMLGNFDKGNDVLEGEQLNAIIELCVYFVRNGLPYEKIIFHREYSNKTCPGTGIDKTEFIETIKSRAEMGKEGK